jgi:nicotinamidase-related amidase
MRTGDETGFDVVTLTDCTATVSVEARKYAIETNFPMFPRPVSHDAFRTERAG